MSFRPGAGEEMEAALAISRPLPILFSYIAVLARRPWRMGDGNLQRMQPHTIRSIFKARFQFTSTWLQKWCSLVSFRITCFDLRPAP